MYHPPALIAPAPLASSGDSFALYFEIPSAVILFGDGRHWHASEHRHAGKLLRELDALGKSGTRIRGLICERGALTQGSTRALNCYLRHGRGLSTYNTLNGHPPHWRAFTRYDWADLIRILNLHFSR